MYAFSCGHINGNKLVAVDRWYSTEHKSVEKITATELQPNRTVLKRFAILKNCVHSLELGETPSTTLQRCRKRVIFTMGVSGEFLYPFSDVNEISPLSKTLK